MKGFHQNLKLIAYHDHLNDEGEFVAWTVLFTDVDRGRRMVAMVDGGALFEPAMFPNCKAFDVGHLAQDHLAPVEFPSEVIIGLVKTAIRHEVEPAKDE